VKTEAKLSFRNYLFSSEFHSMKKAWQQDYAYSNLVMPTKLTFKKLGLVNKHRTESWKPRALPDATAAREVKPPHTLMGPKTSLPCSRQPVSGPNPQPDESNPHSRTLFN
jgi:hypothetical protein